MPWRSLPNTQVSRRDSPCTPRSEAPWQFARAPCQSMNPLVANPAFIGLVVTPRSYPPKGYPSFCIPRRPPRYGLLAGRWPAVESKSATSQPKNSRDVPKALVGHALTAPLYADDHVPAQPGFQGKRLLGKAFLESKLPYSRPTQCPTFRPPEHLLIGSSVLYRAVDGPSLGRDQRVTERSRTDPAGACRAAKGH